MPFDEDSPKAGVTVIIERLEIVDIDLACFRQAALLPGESLRNLDAIHLAVVAPSRADPVPQAGTSPTR